jgi:predicted permease
LDFPFATKNIFTASLSLPAEEYPDITSHIQFYEKLLPELSDIAGVEAAALADGLPASGNGTRVFAVEGQSYGSYDDYPIARKGIVTPGYFETFQTPILQGRVFSTVDLKESLPVVIVNESFVRKFFPESDVLGRRIRVGRPDRPSPWRTIIGVVPDMFMEGMRKFMAGAGPAGFYIPMSHSEVGKFVRIAVRTRGAPMAVTPDVRAAVESLDPNLPIYNVISMQGVIAKETWPYWVFSEMFVVFGFIALFLASVGLYSVMRFAVSRRTKELGIRMAFGANSQSLVRLVMTRGVAQLGVGMTLGIALATSAARPLQFLLYEGDARDPAVFGLVVLSLAVTGLLASFFPARRITRLDPMLALTPE